MCPGPHRAEAQLTWYCRQPDVGAGPNWREGTWANVMFFGSVWLPQAGITSVLFCF